MAELNVRGVEPEVVSKLTQRAEKHRRSVEEELREILRDTLLGGNLGTPAMTFEQYLRRMPDVGEDADYARITGSIREADLAD
jgi:plasmid stability protein